MLVGHLPAGYLVFGPITRRAPPAERSRLLAAALVGSVAPDVDMLAFLVTGGHVHHHSYPTHWPLVWLAATALGLLVAAVARRADAARLVAVVGAAALLHLALDTIAGAVRWLAPFSDRATTLVEVPATHASWVLSMATHWTFAVEIALVVVALGVWTARRRTARPLES